MTLILRTLTLKSKLNFGYSDIKNLTIQELINLKREVLLINYYYKLSMINYSQEVLDILGIDENLVIPKPGKSKDNILKNLAINNFYSKMTKKNEIIHKKKQIENRNRRMKTEALKDSLKYSKPMLAGKNKNK
jgi:hypothetical protein